MMNNFRMVTVNGRLMIEGENKDSMFGYDKCDFYMVDDKPIFHGRLMIGDVIQLIELYIDKPEKNRHVRWVVKPTEKLIEKINKFREEHKLINKFKRINYNVASKEFEWKGSFHYDEKINLNSLYTRCRLGTFEYFSGLIYLEEIR